MKDIPDYQRDLASIREAMERSVKFLSLSGLSGVWAGLYALAGAMVAYYLIYYPGVPYGFPSGLLAPGAAWLLAAVAALVLVMSVATAFIMSWRKAKRLGVGVWNRTSRDLLTSLLIPLVAGGVFILALLYHLDVERVASASLIFYGFALLNASRLTVSEIRYLALSEIVIGLFAAFWPEYSLLAWAVGFGLLHVVYGSIMHYRYDS